MGRLTAVSFRSYRGHQLELRDAGRDRCTVIIHPPGGRASPVEVRPEHAGATLIDRFNQAKAMIDAVLGPRPPVTPRPGYGYPPPR